MNTLAHAVVNAGLLGRKAQPQWVAVIMLGAILPDLTMMIFYAIAKLQGIPEQTIWQDLYNDPAWQLWFDIPNSIPLLGLTALTFWKLQRPGWALLFVSMLLHSLTDLPLHHHDAHRHFWPLTDWRFNSPVSYWDPKFYGDWFSAFEIFAVASGAVYLWRKFDHKRIRWLIGAVALGHISYLLYVILVWGNVSQ